MSSYDKNQAYSTEWSDDEQPTAYSGNENGGNGNSFEDDSSTGRGVRVRALYDYEGQEQDELSFKAGNHRPGLSHARVLFMCPHSTFLKVAFQILRPTTSTYIYSPNTFVYIPLNEIRLITAAPSLWQEMN